MPGTAIGFIETLGLVPAVEALDAMLKAASVSLIGCTYTTGGLVAVMVGGDVGAVKASVEAGLAAASRLGRVVSSHVIPRPDPQLEGILPGDGGPKSSGDGSGGGDGAKPPSGSGTAPALGSEELKRRLLEALRAVGKEGLIREDVPLEEHGLNKLRAIVRALEGPGEGRSSLYYMKKDEVLRLLAERMGFRG